MAAKAMPKAAAKTSQAKTVGGGHPRSPNGARSETEKDIRKNPKNIWSPDWDELAKEVCRAGREETWQQVQPSAAAARSSACAARRKNLDQLLAQTM